MPGRSGPDPAVFAGGTPQAALWDPALPVHATAVSVVMVPMFHAARGTLPWAALFHFQRNTPMWPDGQPWDMYLHVAVALVVVALNWPAMTHRGEGVTEAL